MDRLKYRVWDKRLNRYLGNDDPTQMLLENGNLAYLDDEGMKFYEVEQCTGLRDKNGKLIYEKDLVTKGDDIYVVNWCHQKQGYIFRNLNCIDDVLESLDITMNDWQVIGNIHENADLLGEE